MDHPAYMSQQLCASRGTFKTTIINAHALRQCLRHPGYSVLKKSMTQPLAEEKVLEIMRWCETKPLLKKLFGYAFPSIKKGIRWARRAIQFTNGSMIVAAGIGTRVQGMHFDQIDEDDTIGPRKDDATGEELAPTQEDIIKAQRDHEANFYLAKHYGTFRNIVANTRWAPNDLIQYQREREAGFCQFIEFSAVGPDGKPTFPEQWPADALERDKKRNPFLHAGQVELKPMPLSKLTFPPDSVKTYDKSPAWMRKRCAKVITILDPCGQSTAKGTSQWALVTVGIDPDTNRRYVLDSRTGDSMNYKAVGEAVFDVALAFKPTLIGIEINIQETFAQWLEDEAKRRLLPLPLHPFKSGTQVSKEDRIRTLVPLAMYDMLYFHVSQKQLLEHTRTHPFCLREDDLDAVSLHLRFAPRQGYALKGDEKQDGLWRYVDEKGSRRLVMDYGHYIDHNMRQPEKTRSA